MTEDRPDAPPLYVGLMSGTSLDGVDGVLASFAEDSGPATVTVRAHAHRPFSPSLREELLALNQPGADELHRAALAGTAVARLYAEVVEALLDSAGIEHDAVRAIGAHGQTVRHRPGEFDGVGYTLQVNAPALLAERCGIDVVADFRSRDVAAGGLGAPLVPAFHSAVFRRPDRTIAVLNLGGIANLTVLRPDGPTLGFDCGPANALMDHWSSRHTGKAFDEDGAWAATGGVDSTLLSSFMSEPFFALGPPKSTGRDLFHSAWLERRLQVRQGPPVAAQDVQATLAELTAQICARDALRYAAGLQELLVCGGGARNRHVMGRLANLLPGVEVRPTDDRGLPATQVEACAFAWLASAFIERRAGNLTAVTGAAGPRVLGALYPARVERGA